VQIENSGSQIIKLLKKLKGNRKIDYLNSHGTGTLPNDEIEAKAIKEVFGSKQSQPLINATKGILGHSIGASGALEAAVTALSIKKSIIHGNQIPDPIEGVNLVSQTIEKPVTYAVSTSYGFGGHNGGILFKRYNLNF
jgi:3-oxoacyl-[acyl-carrier-protein] synthase II